MHTRYPLARVEDINDDLAEAITKVLGAKANITPALNLRDVLDWHHRANPADSYTQAVHSRILELANALQLHSITNGRPELYETYETDSDRHNRLLMRLGVYTEDDQWDDDFIDYRTAEWGDQTISLGVPYAYHPDIAEDTYRVHRILGKFDRPYGISIEHYEFIETVQMLGELEELGALEEGIITEIDNDLITSALHTHKEAGTPLKWTLQAEELFRTKGRDSTADIYTAEQLLRLSNNVPEDAASFYTEWLTGDYPTDSFDACIDCYLDIRDAGYPLDVALKSLRFNKTGPEVIELFNTLTVEYAFQLL